MRVLASLSCLSGDGVCCLNRNLKASASRNLILDGAVFSHELRFTPKHGSFARNHELKNFDPSFITSYLKQGLESSCVTVSSADVS